MDEFNNGLSEDREFSQPDPDTEYTTPEPETEYTFAVQETVHRSESGNSESRIRRVMMYTAASAVAVGLLTASPAPEPEPEPEPAIEYVEVLPGNELIMAAVKPDEPDMLYFEEYINIDRWPNLYSESHYSYYLVYADGTETELFREYAPFNRDGFIAREFWESQDEEKLYAYRLYDSSETEMLRQLSADPEWSGYGNIDLRINCARIEGYEEGMQLKWVFQYREDDVYKQMTSTRPVTMLSEPDVSITFEAVPRDDGYSDVHYQLVFHPRADDLHHYFFGDTEGDYRDIDDVNEHLYYYGHGDTCIFSFCTRWYDADHQFLHSGWESVSIRGDAAWWPYPVVERSGRDIIFTYDGPVYSRAEDPAAAYYSLEMLVVDANSGWHYVFESEQLPVTD